MSAASTPTPAVVYGPAVEPAAGTRPLAPRALSLPMKRHRRGDAEARRTRQAADRVLVDGILRGDEDAFRGLVERYQRPLFWVANDILLDADEARDVVQETFIRVHAAIERYDRSRDLMNWLFRIARNLAIDHYRRRRRRALPVEDVAQVVGGADERSGAASALEGTDHAPSADLPDQVAAVLALLPVDYRLALTLREFHGLAPREIARVTDCSYPTARWRLHRARALFRKAWEERYGAAPVFEGGSA